MIAVTAPRFSMGRVVTTPGAAEAMVRAGQNPWELLSRHVAGDWGVVDAGDADANAEALKTGSRILSAYVLTTGEKVLVITEAKDGRGVRASTCLLLPEEY